ncbi:hypothetical protein [Pleionea litopenaei]|uniref:Uncharacterized protein n=1 Tax=Pleionea litopenaei TaxID=3070815 RepID=A0AA51X5R3_9GAMM|nr:hypothetical protein [Pleionea sp. HL-JVS1]WMS86288.1 hypothetical protein Q9312_13775 [Pleionea sp. HL-JVS1]
MLSRAFVLIFFSTIFSSAFAQKTPIKIYVLAHGAKFIGDKTDGATVEIRRSDNQQLLAQGITTGGTGNTTLIMKTDHATNMILTDDQTASFTTVLDIDKPTKITITARGPLSIKPRGAEVSTQVWLIPGKDFSQGNAITLSLRGFLIDASVSSEQNSVQVETLITLMCGCPVEPEGLWNASDYQLNVALLKNDQLVEQKPLNFTQDSQFEARFEGIEPGVYQVMITAFDPITANSGVQELSVTVK